MTTFDQTNLPDQFRLDSGLREAIDRYTIVNAYFARTNTYNEGKSERIYLIGFDEDTETYTIKMSVGADWDSPDSGRTITHPTKTRINMNSLYGHWMRSALTIPELRDELIRRDGEAGGLGPTRAALWNNLVLKLEAQEIQMGRPGKTNPPRSYLMPVEYLGIAEDDSGQASVPSASMASVPRPAPAPSAPAATPVSSAADKIAAARAAKASPVSASSKSPLWTEIENLARNSSSHDDFLNKAFENDAVLADEELAMAVATEENGIFAQVRR